jgi:hypothetical protein
MERANVLFFGLLHPALRRVIDGLDALVKNMQDKPITLQVSQRPG